MADPELTLPKLPKLVPLAAPYRQALFGVATAMGVYNDLRRLYGETAQTLGERPAGVVNAATPPPGRRFNIRSLMSGALLKSRRSEPTSAETHGRPTVLNGTSGENLANMRTVFDAAAKELDNIAARVKEAQARSGRPDILVNLRVIGSSLASARKLVADGQARFDAYGVRQQDHSRQRRPDDSDVSVQESLAVSEHRRQGIQPDGLSVRRPTRRANLESAQSSSPTPQQRKDPLEAHYGLRMPPREPLPPLPQPARGRQRSR